MAGRHQTADHISIEFPVIPCESTASPVSSSSTFTTSTWSSNMPETTAVVRTAFAAPPTMAVSPRLGMSLSMAATEPSLEAAMMSVLVALTAAEREGLVLAIPMEGPAVGSPEGWQVGWPVGLVGCKDGCPLGCLVGCPVGCPVGTFDTFFLLGVEVGCLVGCPLGRREGCRVGCPVGLLVGCRVGSRVGCPVGVCERPADLRVVGWDEG